MSARSAGWVPQQHGAWAMLASPLVLGALASGPAWIHLPLAAFWFAGYFLFYAASMWLKSGRKARYLPATRAYAGLAAVLGVVTALAAPGLLRWVPWFLLPLGVGLWAAAHRQERALLAGLTTVLASALMTVVAYDAGPGEDLRRAVLLAVGQFLYFGGTVWYVKSMIRERGNLRFRRLSVGWHALSTVAVATFSLPLAAVFLVLTVRAWIVPRFSFSPKQIGIAEIASTLAVALVSLFTVG
ncbi:MAG TPA: YwiC-like family protein [Dermatophilaceae bacterium]|nr:YwiC-like family protein [Dermatophilaceae bacterium]